ncbi:MAG: PH domain-containing protein [Alphaproteobacteria bacterium]|nr:PH domain-containing protein [Alphaproteobacteria bacterium]MCD8570818.1 PH domain-containing protein [Alphaproteobacteria bacterium]
MSSLNSWSETADVTIKDMLVEGEKVVFWGRVHWGIYWKAAAVIAMGLLVMLFVVFELGIILLIAGALMAAHAVLKKNILLLVLTDRRLLVRYGMLQVDVVEMKFKNIESIELGRMLPGFLMGYANVIVMGIGQRFLIIPYIANGVQFRRKFNELTLEKEEG